MLVADLVREEKRGTLNFIRLSPQSAQQIFVGKVLVQCLLRYRQVPGNVVHRNTADAVFGKQALGSFDDLFFGFYLFHNVRKTMETLNKSKVSIVFVYGILREWLHF